MFLEESTMTRLYQLTLQERVDKLEEELDKLYQKVEGLEENVEALEEIGNDSDKDYLG